MSNREAAYTAIPNWLILHPDVTPAALRVFAVLGTRADRQTGVCWPSHATVARESGYSVDTVKRALTLLRDLGAIRWQQGRRGATNRYRLTLGNTPPMVGQDGGAGAATLGRECAPTMGRPCPTEPTPVNYHQEPPHDGADAPRDDEALFDPPPAPVAATPPPQTAQTLVARWVDGFRAANHGRDPAGPLTRRVAGQCGRLARSCRNDTDWGDAWRACYSAGRRGWVDPVKIMANAQPVYAPRNYDLEAVIAASGTPPTVRELPPPDSLFDAAMRYVTGRAG